MLCTVKAGNGVEVTITFTNKDGAAADPTAASVVVSDPAGAETTYTGDQLANPGTGVYTLTIEPTTPGRWYVKGVGTGTVVAVEEDYVLVLPTVA